MGLIIGISGKIGSGKDTVAEKIIEQFKFLNFEYKSFAHNIKKISEIITGLPYDLQITRKGKQQYLKEWGLTVGEIQQKIGADLFRDSLHPNTWILALFAQYKTDDFWVIPDTRFPNEVEYIKEKNGIVIRLEGDPLGLNKKDKRNLKHKSESALDHYTNFDITYKNTAPISNLDNLMLKIEKQLKQRNII